MKRSLVLTITMVVYSLLLGCAPAPSYLDPSYDRSSMISRGLKTSSLSSNDSAWRCPTTENVELKDHIGESGFDYSNNGSYLVCVGRDQTNQFKISGHTSAGSICIYPFESVYGKSLTPVEAPQCFSVGSGSLQVNFTSKSINYLIIIDSKFSSQMNACLSGTSSCPPYSEGLVQ